MIARRKLNLQLSGSRSDTKALKSWDARCAPLPREILGTRRLRCRRRGRRQSSQMFRLVRTPHVGPAIFTFVVYTHTTSICHVGMARISEFSIKS